MSHTALQSEVQSFSSLGLAPKLLASLERVGFTTPTPVQAKAIPIAVEGRDVIGIAQTGTGKTLAFSLPMIQQIARTKRRGLVVLPTRELAEQVQEELGRVVGSLGLRTALLIGGASVRTQIRQLKQKPHVIIGTPGRINDHLEQGTLKLGDVGVLVLDEADRMLDMGFEPQIKRILKHVPTKRQTLLFSATMPREIMQLVHRYMNNPTRVEVARSGSVAERVDQELFVIAKNQRNRLLDKLLEQCDGTVLVFSRTKYGAKKICRAVRSMGHTAGELHSNLTLGQRRRSLEGFKKGTHRVLVATDIAARGIDVSNIALVVNYDLPDSPDDYVHRVGRTGRAGQGGRAVSFVTPDQRDLVRRIERLVNQALPVTPLPELPPERQLKSRDTYRTREQKFSNQRRRVQFEYAEPQRRGKQRQQNRRNSRTQSRADRRTRVHV